MRRRLLRAGAGIERQRLALADARAAHAVRDVDSAVTVTAGVAGLAGLALALVRVRPRRPAGHWHRWVPLAIRATGLLLVLTRTAARRTP